jgi:hypothetical protein
VIHRVLGVVRVHGLVLVAAALASLFCASLAIVTSIWLRDLAAPRSCLEIEFRYTAPCLSMSDFLAVDASLAAPLMGAQVALPFVAGVLVGGSFLAAELEESTVVFAWSLTASRKAWLSERLAIIGGLLAVSLAAPAIAGNVLEAARTPWLDTSSAVFADYGARGALLVARGVAVFAITASIGLVVGRVISTLVIGSLVATLLFVSLAVGQTIALPQPQYLLPDPTRYYLDYSIAGEGEARFMSADGATVSYNEILAQAPMPADDPAFDRWFVQHFERMSYAIAGDSLVVIERRELVALLVVSGAAVWATAVAVDRRRVR